MIDYTLKINDVDFTGMVERDSYNTSKIPVYSDPVMTMDGITHVALLRNKGELSFEMNPQNATDTETACRALLSSPCKVEYFNLQTQEYETVYMSLSQQSANYLSRCYYKGLRWNQMDSITLTEL